MRRSVSAAIEPTIELDPPLEGDVHQHRRQYPRLVPHSPLFVHFGEHTALVSDVSEGGLGVHGAFPEFQNQLFGLMLDLPHSSSAMRATAQIAWTSDSKKRTGLHFVDLPASSRQHLRDWMSAQVGTVKEPSPWAFRGPAQFNAKTIHGLLTSGVSPNELEAAWWHHGLRRLTSFYLTVVPLFSALILLGYYAFNWGDYRQTETLAPAVTAPNLPSAAQVETANLSPATNPSPSTVPINVPGFVLQVGAMTQEANADGLLQTLQQNDFPAFVFRRNTDRFYKVVVGSFADAESAVIEKRKLQDLGFETILLHWSPE